MVYLRALIKKLIRDNRLAKEASLISTDKELLGFLLNHVTQEEIEIAFAHHYGIKYKKLEVYDVDEGLMSEFNPEFLKGESILPYAFDTYSNQWKFAIDDLADRKIQSQIRDVINQKEQSVEFTFSFEHELKDIYNQIKSKVKREIVVDESANYDAISWVEQAINNGIELEASDVHIERHEFGLKIRYRVDGVISSKHSFTLSDDEVSNIIVRLKIIGDMNISEKRRSQDGRIDHYEYKSKLYSLRVSTVNTIDGEKFVMRLFSEDDSTASFKDLGFSREQQERINKMIRKTNGIVYLAGATGSGKTTTLYSMINSLDKEALNIYTIESPVEKGIIGINQIQVDEGSGNTYPSILKTLLRQDPDVMVVGEIREPETAKLAVQASLTGHLVLTTIHANSALDSLSRLIDIGIEDYLIGASSVGFMSQRLTRRLCPNCKVKVEIIPDHQKLWIEEEIEKFDYNTHKRHGEHLYESRGCDKCVNGYKGRVAIIEIIEVDEEMKGMISRGVDLKEISDYILTTRYESLKLDGITKALEGITSIQEVMGKLES